VEDILNKDQPSIFVRGRERATMKELRSEATIGGRLNHDSDSFESLLSYGSTRVSYTISQWAKSPKKKSVGVFFFDNMAL